MVLFCWFGVFFTTSVQCGKFSFWHFCFQSFAAEIRQSIWSRGDILYRLEGDFPDTQALNDNFKSIHITFYVRYEDIQLGLCACTARADGTSASFFKIIRNKKWSGVFYYDYKMAGCQSLQSLEGTYCF